MHFEKAKISCVQASGADALELNLSCPHGMGERGMGLACGQVLNFEMTQRFTFQCAKCVCVLMLKPFTIFHKHQ